MHAQLETGNLKNIQLPVIPTVLVPHSTLKAWFLYNKTSFLVQIKFITEDSK
jgi:hypothetical protein